MSSKGCDVWFSGARHRREPTTLNACAADGVQVHMLRAGVVGAALMLVMGHAAALVAQAPADLVRRAQVLLGAGVPLSLVVERQDLAPTGGEMHGNDPGTALEPLQSEGGAWEVSRGPAVHIARRERPHEVDEALAATVLTDGQPLSVGRAIFILPRLALNGELHGVVGGGVPSEACQLDREVHMDSRARTLRQFLDAVVRQAPGVGWVLVWDRESPRDTLSLGVVCADGSLSVLGVYPSG